MSLIKKGASASEVKKFQDSTLSQYARSRFNFLNVHQGLRPGIAHGVLGTPGSGKSTLVKSIIADTAEKLKTLVWLSEETIVQYQGKLSLLKCKMDNVVFIEERDIKENAYPTLDSLIMFLTEEIAASGVKAFFWDNLTTSKIYESLKPNIQGKFFTAILNFCDENDIIFVYVAHTKQGISDNHRQLIEGEDMRGSAYPFTQSPYFYIFQRFTIGTKVYAFVHVRKHRFHDEVEQKFYLLNFKDGIYVDDRQLEFNKLNDFFKQRNHLGKKDKEPRRKPSP
jgi:ABC-type dipeptide/oligopeptide/nickel transport system ATPase component